MLELDTIRGPHSTGVFAVKSSKETSLVKQVGTPWELYETSQFQAIFRGINKVLIGHNRWATKGKINRANAHPFEFTRIAGAHNGTLRTTHMLDDHHMFDVDSENLYYHMDKNGVEDTIRNLDGAFALTWYDKQENTINLIRNEERPLYYALSEDNKTLFWASEDWMIENACDYGGVKIQEINLLPVGFLHSFDVPFTFGDTFNKVRVRRMELFPKPVVYYGSTASKTNGGGNEKKNTVVPLQSGPTGKVKRSFAEYQKYVGKHVTFYVGYEKVNHSGQTYLQCWHADDDCISIRVFAEKGSVEWNWLADSQFYFEGRAKSYSSIDNGYLAIDLRSLREIKLDLETDTPPETFKGYEDEEIDEQEWLKRTKNGCAWCASPIVKNDEEAVWIAKDEIVCGDCCTSPEVKKYLTN